MKFNILASGAAAGVMAFALAACEEPITPDPLAEDPGPTDMAALEPAEPAPPPPPAAPPGPPPAPLAIDAVGGGQSIDVTLPDAIDSGTGEVDRRFTGYGDNINPAIEWTAVDGAESYVVVLQDPVEMPTGATFMVLHWAAYNIPGTSLPEGVPAGETIEGGGNQIANLMGNVGYNGMQPPANRPQHQYTWQVFALDTTLDLPSGANFDALLDAMRGHVIGSGSEITPYSPPDDAQPMPGVSMDD